MKVAICFCGLTRSLQYTYESIKTRIYDVLEANNIQYDTYAHFFLKDQLTLQRSGEHNVPLQRNEYQMLPLTYWKLEEQDTFDAQFDWKRLTKYKDYYNTNYENLKNVIRFYYSLHQVSLLIDQAKKYNDYDAFLFLRPDTYYIDNLPLDTLIQIRGYKDDQRPVIYTPQWHTFSRINDRLACCNKAGFQLYTYRYNIWERYYSARGTSMESEALLLQWVKENNVLRGDFPLRARRVRAHGAMIDDDLETDTKRHS